MCCNNKNMSLCESSVSPSPAPSWGHNALLTEVCDILPFKIQFSSRIQEEDRKNKISLLFHAVLVAYLFGSSLNL